MKSVVAGERERGDVPVSDPSVSIMMMCIGPSLVPSGSVVANALVFCNFN